MSIKCQKIGALNVGIIPIQMEDVIARFVELIIRFHKFRCKSQDKAIRSLQTIILGQTKIRICP